MLPHPLGQLRAILQRGLPETALLGPTGRVAYRWVHRAAPLLTNEDQHPGVAVKHRLSGLRGAMMRHRAAAGALAPALANFLKISRSDWPGLFHCSNIPDLPRTNNDLDQSFGAHRYHERRTTGRKGASPAWVLRGSVQLLAATATRLRVFAAWELPPEDVSDWKTLRHELDTRRQRRTLRLRLRRDPDSYLAQLETALLKLTLPP